MIQNSLVDAYRKANILRKKLYADDYKEKLKKRLDFYEQEGMISEYYKVLKAIQEFEQLENALEYAFVKPEQPYWGSQFSWQEYFRKADQLLYGEQVPDFAIEDYYGTNHKLLSVAVKELNKKFPHDKWELGSLPFYRWNILNYPGYEPTEMEIESWENNPNIKKDDFGYYIEYSAKEIKCIHSSQAKSILTNAKGDIHKLYQACEAVKESMEAYIVDEYELIDGECSGGYDLGLEIVFDENATKTFYGKEMTPVEQLINSTIVSELDTKLKGSRDMDILHKRLCDIDSKIEEFLAKNNFKKASSESALSNQ